MLLHVVLCAVLATSAYGNYTANLLMDDILGQMVSQARNTGLDPTRITPFQLKVKGTGLTNRDFKANFTQGSLFGLSQLRRKGDCSMGTFGTQVKMGCYLSLAPLRFMMNAEVKGDSLAAKVHSISTTTTVSANSLILIELQGYRNFQPRISSLTIRPVTMTTSVTQGKVDLNSSRRNDFVKQVNDNLAQRLAALLKGSYSSVLNGVANTRRMP